MTNLILAGLGGCVGAMARVGLSGAIARAMDRAGFWSAFPIATFCVNALGSLLIGFLLALNLRRRAGRLYDIFYVQLRYAAVIAGARICYRCAKRGLKRMRLYAFCYAGLLAGRALAG